MLLSSYFQQLFHAFSFKKFSLFLSIFVLAITLILGSTALVVVFILKPHQPVFSLQAIKLDSYKLDVSGDSTLYVSSVVSLTLIAGNPNKFGVGYSPTVLHLLYQSDDIGMVIVPGFYQPAHSKNLTFETEALFQCVNVSEILSGISRNSRNNDSFQASIVGDVVAEVRLLHVHLPKVKLALECNISIDQSSFMYSVEALHNMKAVKNHTISLPINWQSFSKECSIAVYI
nr:NDR1/HIN1-like protein 13 [Ipomoea batatas]